MRLIVSCSELGGSAATTNERLRDEELDALRESLRQLESSGFLKVNPITAQKIESRIESWSTAAKEVYRPNSSRRRQKNRSFR